MKSIVSVILISLSITLCGQESNEYFSLNFEKEYEKLGEDYGTTSYHEFRFFEESYLFRLVVVFRSEISEDDYSKLFDSLESKGEFLKSLDLSISGSEEKREFSKHKGIITPVSRKLSSSVIQGVLYSSYNQGNMYNVVFLSRNGYIDYEKLFFERALSSLIFN